MENAKLCPWIKGCAFYAANRLEESMQSYVKSYCESEFTKCRRYQKFEAHEPVDGDYGPMNRNEK